METHSEEPITQDESAPSYAVVVKLPLSSEMGTEEERNAAYAFEDQLYEAFDKVEFGDVDGNEVGQGEFGIWILTDDPEATVELAQKVVDASTYKDSAEIEVFETEEEYAFRLSLFIPLSDDEDGTEAERAKYQALATKMGDALLEAELGEVDVVFFGDGEAIISAGVVDGIQAAGALEEILTGEDLPEESRIQIEENGADEEEEEEA